MPSKYDAINSGNAAVAQYAEQIKTLSATIQEIAGGKSEIASQREATMADIAKALLPDLSDVTIAMLKKRTGINMSELLVERSALKAKIFAQLSSIEAEDDFVNNKALQNILRQDKNSEVESKESLSGQRNRLANLSNFNEFLNDSQNEVGFFGGVWSSISGKNTRRIEFYSAASRVLSATIDSNASLKAKLQELDAAIQVFNNSIDAIDARYSRMIHFVSKQSELTSVLATYDHDTLVQGRKLVAGFFGRCQDLVTLRNQFDGTIRILLTTLHSQNQKIDTFSTQISRLKREENEISTVKNKISGVVSKWRRSSKSYVNGDKTNWLVNAPASRAKRVARLSSSSRTIYRSSYGYVDYGMYDLYLDNDPFMPIWYVGLDSYDEVVPQSMLQEFIPDYDPGVSYDIPNEGNEESLEAETDLENSDEALDAFAEDSEELNDDSSESVDDESESDVSDES
jgi:prefoldin subunit 5